MRIESKGITARDLMGGYPVRLCCYGLMTFVLFQLVAVGVRTGGASWMGRENGPIELTQLALALIGSAAYFFAACRAKVGKLGLVFGGAVIGYAAARESDMLFERFLFDDAYKWLVGVPLCLFVLATAWIERKKFLSESWELMQRPAGTLFVVAGVFLMAVCQPLDKPAFWASISDPGEVVATKALFEEYAELFAYLLLAISGTEAAIAAIGGTATGRISLSIDEPRPSMIAKHEGNEAEVKTAA